MSTDTSGTHAHDDTRTDKNTQTFTLLKTRLEHGPHLSLSLSLSLHQSLMPCQTTESKNCYRTQRLPQETPLGAGHAAPG